MWRDAHPDLALALLSDDEVNALATVAQKSTDPMELSIPFDKTFPIATYMGYTLSIRVRSV